MTEYGEPSHEKKDADGRDACKPSMTRMSVETSEGKRRETRERKKSKDRKINAAINKQSQRQY